MSKSNPLCQHDFETDLPVVAKIDAIQAEFSPFETLHEDDGLIPTARELDIAFVAYDPLGHGWLVDDFPYQTPDDFNSDDYRRQSMYTGSPSACNESLTPVQFPSSKARTFTPTRRSLRTSRRSRSARAAR